MSKAPKANEKMWKWTDEELIFVDGIPLMYTICEETLDMLVIPHSRFVLKTVRWKTDVLGKRTPAEQKLVRETPPITASELIRRGHGVVLPTKLRIGVKAS
jgi:hypothetical protein